MGPSITDRILPLLTVSEPTHPRRWVQGRFVFALSLNKNDQRYEITSTQSRIRPNPYADHIYPTSLCLAVRWNDLRRNRQSAGCT